MKLVPIERYVAAVSRIWQRVRLRHSAAGLTRNATETTGETATTNVLLRGLTVQPLKNYLNKI